MSTIDLLLAIAGIGVTAMVVVGMFLITPGGIEAAPPHTADPPEGRAEPSPPVLQTPVGATRG